MNEHICSREEQTSAAIASGTMDPELVSHAQRCPVCADILLAGEFLRKNAPLADHERAAVPEAGLIWRKAQNRANQHALRLALRPIRLMTFVASIAFICSPWLRLVLPLAQYLGSSWSRALDFNLLSLAKFWPASSNQLLVLVGFSGTMILLALSSWLMLRRE